MDTVEFHEMDAQASRSPDVRFRALAAAVHAAARGNYSLPLPLDGHDRLSVLAHDIQALLCRARQQAAVAGNGGHAPAGDSASAYESLAKANARLEYLVANTPAIIYSSVPSGDFKMTFVSANAGRVLGYSPAEMVEDPNFWFNHIHPEDVPVIFSSLALVFVEGQRTYEYRFRRSDGEYLWMHDTLRLIRDGAGNPVEVIGSLTDITDRKAMEDALKRTGEEQKLLIDKLQKAQAQLLQSEKMASIGQLAAGVAHEINNPVGFVNSNMGSLNNYVATLLRLVERYDRLLQDERIPPSLRDEAMGLKVDADLDFVREDVTALVAESMEGLKRVKDIVQALKDFSHVGESDWQVADIHHGLESTLNIAHNEIKYKARVIKEFGSIPPVKCLASQLNQVFMNLIVNASQAIPESGEIRIRTEERDGWIIIAISDNGSGIAPEHLPRIFEPFFTTKPVGQGTGLGLSLSYSIVQRHGGRIDVESTPGKGTCFTIRIPIEPPADREQAP